MATFLSDIGPSDMLRNLVSQIDINSTTIPVILDKPRTLWVTSKTLGTTELIAQCHDDEVTVILYLPYADNTVGQASIIYYQPQEE